MGSWVASACVAQPWWLVWPTRPDPSWIPDGGWPMPRSGARPQPGQGPVLARHCHLPAALNTTAQVTGCTLRGMHEAHCPCWGGGVSPRLHRKSPRLHRNSPPDQAPGLSAHLASWHRLAGELRRIEYQRGWTGSPDDLDPSSTPIPGASRHTAQEGGALVSPGTGQQPCGAWAGMAISASGGP